MKKIILALAAFCLLINNKAIAQTYNDGAMDLQMWVTYHWVENYDDIAGNDEYNFIWYGADNADVDGLGWRPNTPNQGQVANPAPKPNQVAVDFAGFGWVSGTNLQLFSQTYGTAGNTPQTVPQYLQLWGEKWEDDCFSCNSSGFLCLGGGCGGGSSDRYRYNPSCCTVACSGCSDDDIYCSAQASSTIDYRAVAPCSVIDNATPSTGWVGDFATGACGGNDVGAEVSVYYTPPIPSSFSAVPSQHCVGGGSTTLNLAGAVFGGTYDIYNETTGSFVVTGTPGPTYVLNVGTTTTFRLYTRNGGCRSLSYRTITVTVASAVAGGTIAANQTICYNTAPAQLTNSVSASGGLGAITYQWESQTNCTGGFGNISGATGSTYSPPALTQTTCFRRVATNATCGTANSNTITVTVQPVVSLGTVSGGGGTFCTTANPGQMSVTGVSGGSGSFNYQWYYQNGTPSCPTGTSTGGWTLIPSATSSTYTPPGGLTQTRTYAVQVDPAGSPDCGPATWASSCVTVTINTAATATAGGPDVVCESSNPGAITLTGASIGGSALTGQWSLLTGGGSLSTTSSVSNPATVTYTPAANFNGTATITLTTDDPTGPCPAVSVTRTITINPGAIVNAGGPDFVCQSATPSAITLAGASVTGSGSSGAWSLFAGAGVLSSTAQTANPSAVTFTPAANFNGTVLLRLTSDDPDGAGPCQPEVATRTITIYSLPSTAPTSNTPVCEGDPINLDANASAGLPAYTYVWNGPASFASTSGTPTRNNATLPMAGAYNVTVTDAHFCSVSGSTTVVVNPRPNGNISGTDTVCSGGSDAITFNFTVGTGPFDISYTDGTNIYTKTGVSSGDTAQVLPGSTATYSYTQITDANGCTRTSGFLGAATITVAQLPTIIGATPTAVLCNGGSTGSITLTSANGTPPYEYSLNGGAYQSSAVFSGLIAGSYNMAIRDALGCTSSYSLNPVVVTEPPLLDHTSTVINASCANVFDGSITVNATGGVTPYSYSVNGGPAQTLNTFNGLGAATYLVQVTDANSCTDTSYVLVDTAYAVFATIDTQTNVSCFGGTDGTVTVQIAGGISPYTYSINGTIYQGSPTFTGLAAGNYVAISRDTKGCTAFAPVTITQPNLLQALVDSVSNILCNGGTTGGIYITVIGGTAPYQYQWSNGAQTEDITGIGSGTYNVAVTDAKGCSTAAGVTISQPLPLFVTVASFNNLNCFNDSSGVIDITVSGGVPPYNFNWSNGSNFEDIYGLQAGTYDVTVNDANGCVQNLSQILTEPTLLSTSVSITNVSCAGAANGAVDLTVSGGTPGYNYLWSNGVTTQDVSGLSGGTYTVVITDSKGCNAANTAVVNEGTPLVITANVTNVACNGNNTGVIDITVNGGVTPYTFAWSNSAVTEDLAGVIAGTYTVTVTDQVGCTGTATYTITQPNALTVVLAGNADVSCFGGNNGSIDINVFGGAPLYTYLWTNGDTSEDLNGLTIGTYDVTVTDNNGCQATLSTTITQPAVLATSVTKVDVTCPGAANGSVDLTVTGGVGPYTYLWNNGTTTEDLSGITGGNYTVIVTDANSCTAAGSIVVNEGLPLSITGVVTDVLCNGDATGAVNITVSGGNQPYTFAWSNSTGNEDITGVVAGTYSVTVNDVNSCNATATFVVAQPAALVLNASVINVSCNGGNNGSVDITVNGGVFPYTFAWSNSTTNEDVYALGGGTYSVTITDANACTLTQSFTITEPTAIVTSVTGTNVSCNGAADGTADLTVNGGVSPYSFLWSTFQGSEDVTGLSGGLYYVIVTDANGCTKKDSILINEPAPLQLTTTITNISCYNSNDGAIDLTITGGTLAYNYAWSNGATTEDLTGLQNGVYAVTVTDANLCTATTSVTIINPSIITANFISSNPLCFAATNGSIDLIPSGGTPSYTYAWSNGPTTEDITGLGAGTYIVTITDAKGCSRVDSVILTEPLPVVTSGFITQVSCFGNSDGFIDITAYGGTLPYAFNWSTGGSTEDIGSLPGGNYYVTVTDANGCQASTLYPVIEPAQLVVNVVGSNVACFGTATGNVAAVPTGGTTPYYYLWNTFDTDSSIQGVLAGKYTVQVTDSNGCFTYDSIQLTQPTELLLSGVVTDADCFGAATGAVNITVNGGVVQYTFAWSNGATTEDLQNVVAGNYTVTVTDANGCIKTASYTVGDGNEIIAGLATINPICNGGNSGSLSAVVSGGSGPYTYNWSAPSQTGLTLGSLVAGTYALTVTDAKACSVTASATLVDPAPIVVQASATGAKCFNTATGAVSTVVSGGFPPYTYLLNGSAQSSGNFTALPAGEYILLVSDANGCQGTTDFTIASPGQISVDLGVSQQVILTGMETQLVAVATSDTTITHYFWQPDSLINYSGCADPANCPAPYAFPHTTTTFTVFVMNADSCIASDTVTVTVLNQPSTFIPSAFTPNGDGLNDYFEFDLLGATNIEVSIFNRWGQRVYYNPTQPNGISNQNGWDGKVDGKEAPDDTYVYRMKITYWDNIQKDVSGTIAIMR